MFTARFLLANTQLCDISIWIWLAMCFLVYALSYRWLRIICYSVVKASHQIHFMSSRQMLDYAFVCVCVCDTLKRYRATLSSNVVHMLASNWNDMILIGWSYISSILSLERYHLFGCVCEASVTINHIFDVEYVPYEYYIWQWQKFPIFPLIKWRQKCHH